jgi:hypothetical protein
MSHAPTHPIGGQWQIFPPPSLTGNDRFPHEFCLEIAKTQSNIAAQKNA